LITIYFFSHRVAEPASNNYNYESKQNANPYVYDSNFLVVSNEIVFTRVSD